MVHREQGRPLEPNQFKLSPCLLLLRSMGAEHLLPKLQDGLLVLIWTNISATANQKTKLIMPKKPKRWSRVTEKAGPFQRESICNIQVSVWCPFCVRREGKKEREAPSSVLP